MKCKNVMCESGWMKSFAIIEDMFESIGTPKTWWCRTL